MQRLEFIEFMVFWEGGVNRKNITEKFGVSVPQASADLAAYQKIAPDNLTYDVSEKKYIASEKFSASLIQPNSDTYLFQLKGIAESVFSSGDTWISEEICVDALPIPSRKIEPKLLKKMIGAVRSRKSLEIFYQSMSKTISEKIWRRITPHAFAYDGLRWHVRAYCHLDSRFKDFIVSRCTDVRDESEPGAAPEEDDNWNTTIDVCLIPNPRLTENQQRIVEYDFGMTDGRVTISVRRALLYYFEKRLRLDINDDRARPEESPLAIGNADDFYKSLAIAQA